MGRPKTYDRDAALRRAMNLFWDKGFEGSRLSELVAVAGINRFSLYQEFGGKEGLFEAALELYMQDMAKLAEPLLREPAGTANVRSYFEGLLDFPLRHGCFAVNVLREKHVVPPASFAAVERLAADTERAFVRNLRAGKRAGELAPDTEIASLARFLSAFEIGFLSHGILSSRRQERKRMLTFLDRVLGGLPCREAPH